ncbi:hypothetical protein PsorP6_001555 [Peronosclerospora sorghi]|uniref:Uncharacterized protein n=1 Tax=Peronosclerospora sorghi TaxID=230839 RepID=A0ACC0WV84_9STRA|nr:hypothetical protein PsorP6_001555 [Peronosclerospora sorghi]
MIRGFELKHGRNTTMHRLVEIERTIGCQEDDAFIALNLSAQDPYRMENMDVYSNVLYVKEKNTELSRLAHRALKVEKYRPETCCIIGNFYSIKNKHDRAIIYFYRALKLDPNFLSAWTFIGHEYVEMKNTVAAIEAYRHAVDLNTRDYRAWYGLGQAYEILNMFLYSIYYYRKSVAIRPYDARMWCDSGGCYEKLNKIDEAVACFHRAVNNQDPEWIASYHLGRLYASRGLQHDAEKFYQIHLGLRSLSATRSIYVMAVRNVICQQYHRWVTLEWELCLFMKTKRKNTRWTGYKGKIQSSPEQAPQLA